MADQTLTETIPSDIRASRSAGEVIVLSWVDDDHVPRSHRGFVNHRVRSLARRHGLGDVRVRYFGPRIPSGEIHELPDGSLVDGGDFTFTAPEADVVPLGVAPDDHTIALHHGLRGSQVPYTIAHEIRHLIQRLDGRPSDTEDAEEDADAFARRHGLERR